MKIKSIFTPKGLNHTCLTPKGLNHKAQGREAHPGFDGASLISYPEGVESWASHPVDGTPSGYKTIRAVDNPGCASRPWAVRFNPFGVELKCEHFGVTTKRPAFTLLEMILALAIGIMLMTGLYYALDIHLTATSVG